MAVDQFDKPSLPLNELFYNELDAIKNEIMSNSSIMASRKPWTNDCFESR